MIIIRMSLSVNEVFGYLNGTVIQYGQNTHCHGTDMHNKPPQLSSMLTIQKLDFQTYG